MNFNKWLFLLQSRICILKIHCVVEFCVNNSAYGEIRLAREYPYNLIINLLHNKWETLLKFCCSLKHLKSLVNKEVHINMPFTLTNSQNLVGGRGFWRRSGQKGHVIYRMKCHHTRKGGCGSSSFCVFSLAWSRNLIALSIRVVTFHPL